MLVPGAIPTFRPYTAGALAAAIRRVLAMPYEKLTQGFDELRERLSLSESGRRRATASPL